MKLSLKTHTHTTTGQLQSREAAAALKSHKESVFLALPTFQARSPAAAPHASFYDVHCHSHGHTSSFLFAVIALLIKTLLDMPKLETSVTKEQAETPPRRIILTDFIQSKEGSRM